MWSRCNHARQNTGETSSSGVDQRLKMQMKTFHHNTWCYEGTQPEEYLIFFIIPEQKLIYGLLRI